MKAADHYRLEYSRDVQQNLLKELLKDRQTGGTGVIHRTSLTLNWEQEHVPAILNVWFR